MYNLAIQSQCSGGIWPIKDTSIGLFTVSWRYNLASNALQFIIQGKFTSDIVFIHKFFLKTSGQAAATVNLASTYIAIGWSDTAPAMVCIVIRDLFFIGDQMLRNFSSIIIWFGMRI